MQGLFQQVQQEVSAIKRAQQEAARGLPRSRQRVVSTSQLRVPSILCPVSTSHAGR